MAKMTREQEENMIKKLFAEKTALIAQNKALESELGAHEVAKEEHSI